MNVGGSNSFNEIKFARPKNGGEPGLPVEEQKPVSARPSLELISRDIHSEFSPIKVLQRLEAKGDIDPALLNPYKEASFDRQVALSLKKEFFDPVVSYAEKSGRDVVLVKQQLKDAILNQIVLSSAKLRQVTKSFDTMQASNYSLAA